VNRKLADLLYAPIGLVTGASQVIPELAEQGRTQVANARMMGQMATRMGSAKAAEGLAGLTAHARGFLARAGLAGPETDAAPVDAPVDATGRPVVGRSAAPNTRVEVTDAAVRDAPDAEELAIVDYDSLAASQVVPRLAALRPDELEAVRRYELAHRGRKTILGRVAQIQS